MSTDTFVQVAPDSTGKKIRNFLNTLLGNDVYQQVVTVAKSDGTVLDDLARSSVTQPVSGTFFQATQPISATSLPLPTGASTEVTLAAIKAKTDNLDVLLSTRTKPADSQHATIDNASLAITAASLPLPTGASTAAKQPALGTAGTPSADVISIQGEAGMTAVKTDGSAVTQPVSATALPLPTGASTEATLALIKAKTDNIDVALSTRTKPADQQHVIVDSSASVAVTGTVALSGDALESLQSMRRLNAVSLLHPRRGVLTRRRSCLTR